MADPVYARIPDLPAATLPLAIGDLLEVSQSGVSGKAPFGGIFGSGWFAKLAAAFAAFKAPDADHADNADTLGAGEEVGTDFHDATQLTGVAPVSALAQDAQDSQKINGISLLTGAEGTTGEWEILFGSSNTFIIPAGLYVIVVKNNATSGYLKIGEDEGQFGRLSSIMILSDGAHYSIGNSSTSPITCAYRKLA